MKFIDQQIFNLQAFSGVLPKIEEVLKKNDIRISENGSNMLDAHSQSEKKLSRFVFDIESSNPDYLSSGPKVRKELLQEFDEYFKVSPGEVFQCYMNPKFGDLTISVSFRIPNSQE